MSFDEWCDKLLEVIRADTRQDPIQSLDEYGGKAAWRTYYDAGESPEAAYAEDLSYSGEE